MIKDLFPHAAIKENFKPSGLCDVMQFAQNHDILYFNLAEASDGPDIIDRFLPSGFKGLIITTKQFASLNNHNHLVLSSENFASNKREMIDKFYPTNGTKPLVVGVTGTNGKTSTCWLLSEVGRVERKSILYIGTIGVYLNGIKKNHQVLTTTPSYLELQKIIYDLQKSNVIELVALEVSSHALRQGRLKDVELCAAAWTNFTQDHLDYHVTMDDYFDAKKEIITLLKKNAPLYFNASEEALRLRVNFSKSLSCSTLEKLNLSFSISFLKASYNNMSLALSLFTRCFGPYKLTCLDAIKPPPGRFEVIEKNGIRFVVDYAHTPDAVENLLNAIIDDFKGFKIITLLGCGGNRDKTKRPQMAKVACNLSDYTIFTSDNPRDENPDDIIDDMKLAFNEIDKDLVKKNQCITDRLEAIKKSFNLALSLEDDVIVIIAGKGHEAYQEINGVRHHFSDQEAIGLI
jgi:UDP-N-acetylmuramoyl-L-alanyl-D-glutamate--2,6-diaminopimelate ligase